MIIDLAKKLLFGIFIVIVLLGVCVSVDYADNNTIKCVKNQSKVRVANCTEVGDGVFVDDRIAEENKSVIRVKSYHKIHYVHPVITITAKPSCGCRYSYRWHTRSFINYCPYCHRYGVLTNLHKWQSRYEQEISCSRCSADFCGVCGKEKMGYSKVYLRKA